MIDLKVKENYDPGAISKLWPIVNIAIFWWYWANDTSSYIFCPKMSHLQRDKRLSCSRPDSIPMEAFCKEIKRDTSLFIEFIKTTVRFLDMVYREAQKFVTMKKKLKSTKGLLNWTIDKATHAKILIGIDILIFLISNYW